MQNLKSLKGIANRGAFAHVAALKSVNGAEAAFCVQIAALMGQLHQGEHPLARIAMIEDFPVCFCKDSTVIAALQSDYAAWTSRPAYSGESKKLANETGQNGHVLVPISGQMSPRLQEEL